MAMFLHFGCRSLAFNFAWKLVLVHQSAQLVHQPLFLEKSKQGEKKKATEAGIMLSSSAPTASESVSLEVAVSHAECAYQLRSQRAAPFSIPSAAVKYRLRLEQSWTGSTKNAVIQAQLSTSYSDVTST